MEGDVVETLDVRDLMPGNRHQPIFDAFEELDLGEKFVLVNDHDPKPLFYHFDAALPGQFSWRYLQRGPHVWRVEIGRVGFAAV